MKPTILIIGATSKIARRFIDVNKAKYTIYATYRTETSRDNDTIHVPLDLFDDSQVEDAIKSLKDIKFSGVLVFASTYKGDSKNISEYLDNAHADLQINALSPIAMIRTLSYALHAKVILFGDAGLDVPKKGFTGYSLSKAVLQTLTKLLAVELSNQAQVITFKLGPTLASIDHDNPSEYYDRNITAVSDPTEGLIHYCNFLLGEKNLNMTGVEINYDGGAYIKR